MPTTTRDVSPESTARRNDYPAGSVLLRHVFRDVGRVPPLRLRSPFLDRPWPLHSLLDRIVDVRYVPKMEPTNPRRAWNLEIVNDKVIRVDGRQKHMNGDVLLAFNLGLLTRDWALRSDEMSALVFDDKRHPRDIERAFTTARLRLDNSARSHDLFDPPYASTSVQSVARQFSPDMVIRDLR